MSLDLERALEVAVVLACEAGQAIGRYGAETVAKERKADHSWVTEADRVADQIIRQGLNAAYPTHAILTEEAGFSGDRKSPYLWLVDPLDGTKAFLKGVPGYAVMIGLLEQGQPRLGVVLDPVTARCYTAIRGEGAWLRGGGEAQRLRVSAHDQFEKMPVVVSTGFPEDKKQALAKTLTGAWVEPINSVGIKVGLLVRQEADIYVSHHAVHYWDSCAPQIILEEAGGILTQLNGQTPRYDLEAGFSHDALLVASNGAHHAELVQVLSRIF